MFNPNDHQSYYNLMSQVLRNSGISNHDFQGGLYQQLKTHFNQLDPDVGLEYYMGKGYPAQFSIRFKDQTIMTFSFYNHIYRDKNYKTRISRRERDLKRELKTLSEDNKELVRNIFYKINPYKMLNKENYQTRKVWRYQLRDLIKLTVKKKNINKNLVVRIESIKKRMETQEGYVKRIEDDLRELLDKREITDKKHREWVQRFKAWGYENNEQ